MKRLFTILASICVTFSAIAEEKLDFHTVDSLYKAKDIISAVKMAKAILESPEDEDSKGAVLSLTASIYSQAGNLTQAEQLIQRAIELLDSPEDIRERSIAYGRASDIFNKLGKSALAQEYAEKGVSEARKCGDDVVIAGQLLQRSYSLIEKGHAEDAVKDLEFADSVFRAFNLKKELAETCYQIGQIHDSQGKTQAAIEYYRDAVDMAKSSDNLPMLEKACRRLGFALHETDSKEAYRYMKEAAEVQETILKEMAANEIALVTLEYVNLQKDKIIDEKEQQIKSSTKKLFISVIIITFFALLLLEFRRIMKREKRRAEELSKLNDQKNLLFSIIAHDLRSPAIAQQAALKILSKNIDSYSKEEIAEIIKDMSMQAKSEVSLIENVLKWSRTKTRKDELQIARFNVPEAINELVDEFSQSIAQKEINVATEMNDCITLRSERGFIMLVLRNIISNAIKFTPRGGHIDISSFAEDDGARIEIKDDGVGMSKETLGQLFLLQSLVSRKGTDGEMGSGFGLVVSMDLIREIGGNITASSTEGKGSTFVVTIPNINSHERKN